MNKNQRQEKFVFIDKYMFKRSDILGEGAFGKVYKGYYQPQYDEQNLKIPLAIKQQDIPKEIDQETQDIFNSIKQDIVTLKILDHPNIVRLIGITKEKRSIYMVMEYCKEKDLTEYMKDRDFSELEICYFFAQILQAFKHIHNQKLMHRDVKPQNIMINDNVIKVGDFGFAKQFDEKKKNPIYKVYKNEDLDIERKSHYYEIRFNQAAKDLYMSENYEKKYNAGQIQNKKNLFRMAVIHQENMEPDEKKWNFRYQIQQLDPENQVIFGVCDKSGLQKLNEDFAKENKPINIFSQDFIIKNLCAIGSSGISYQSGQKGIITTQKQLFPQLQYGDNVQCSVNLDLKTVVFYIQNQYQYPYQKKDQMIDITLKNAFTGDFDQKNMCVFACIQGPQDAVQITMYNAPRLNESQKGTIITIAPEVFEGFYDDKCDIYSLGCTLYWMIYKKFMYEECKNNAIMLNMEQKKNNIVFPSEPPISDNLKSAIKQMMEYDKAKRIDWEDLFKLPIFNIKLLLQNNNLNHISTIDYDKIQNKVIDIKQVYKEIEDQLEFNKIEKNFEDDEEKEQKALAYVEQVELKIKKQQVNVQMIARLKFEKGKAQVMRIIAKSVKDLTISRKLIYGENRVLIQDLLDLIYFGLNKFELIALKRIVNGLQDIENGYQIFNLKKTEWEMFVNSEDNQEYDKIYRALEKELNVFQNIIFKKAKQEAKKFVDIEIENKESVFKENYKIQNYLDDNISEEYEEIYIVDDLLMILSMEDIFIWDNNQQINFTLFFENRKAKYNQFNEFETTKNRVDQALNTFFSHHV